jgi:hypothetical protein
MAQAFKRKTVPLDELQSMLLLDTAEQLDEWLSSRREDGITWSQDGSGAVVTLPAGLRPQGKAQLVSQYLLSKREGELMILFCCYTTIIWQECTLEHMQLPRLYTLAGTARHGVML